MQPSSGVDDEVLSLPKGGGAVQGLGATFDVDLNTGTGSFTIPFELPTGPNGTRPELSLRYHSGGADGVFGVGWTLGLLAVTRRTDLAVPAYDDGDGFVLAGNENLVATGPGTYRPVVDTMHWLIRATDPGWVLTDTADRVHRLGFTPTSRVAATDAGTERVGSWLLDSITDAFGNTMAYNWTADGNQRYLDQIGWGTYTLAFDYEDRPDRLLEGRFGFPVATSKRCRRITLSVAALTSPLVRSWDLTYDDGGGRARSKLSSVSVTGHGAAGETLSAPATTFGYSTAGRRALQRFDGPIPPDLSSGRAELVDWDGDGLPDILELSAGQARVWRNAGNCRWDPPTRVTNLAAPYHYTPGSVGLVDMDGSGTADLVVADRALPGYYPLMPGGGFGPARSWRRSPPVALADPSARLVDLDGTGTATLLAAGPRSILHYDRDPGGDWREGPTVLARPGDPPADLRDRHVNLADMTGDGLQDLVRVDGSGVTYFPALGRGRWDAPVRMTPSPSLPQHYDPARMYLVDVDGDGCADLLYLDAGRVIVWYNVGTDRLSDPVVVEGTPPVRPGGFRLADMTGDGTIGLVWSSGMPTAGRRPWLFLDLNGGTKPHLLNAIDNGIGLRTTIGYRSSPGYAVDDRQAGQPWTGFHPFPVCCVDRVVQTDQVTGATTTTDHRYHEARYDPATRTFLGFGRVEEEVHGDASSPAVVTTTTFHLGLDPTDPSRRLTGEESLRLGALRRRVLTTSIFGRDGSPDQDRPYHVVRHGYDAKVLAALGSASCVVPFEAQTVEETWERGTAPSAVRQVDYTAVDDHGNAHVQRNRVTRPGQPAPDQDVTTTVTFAAGGTNLVAAPARVTQTAADGRMLAVTVTYYDGPAHQGLPEGQLTTGAVTRVEDLVLTDEVAQATYGTNQPDWVSLGYHRLAGETGWWSTRYSYARVGPGVPGGPGVTTLTTRGPRGGESTSVTDATGQFVRQVTDPMGNVHRAREDPRTSQTASLTDPNGQTTTDAFDLLGRVVANIMPNDSAAAPTVVYDYRGASLPLRTGTAQRISPAPGDSLQTYDFTDGFGRALARYSQGADGKSWVVSSASVYNSQGRMVEAVLPYATGGAEWAAPPAAAPRVALRYDALGRLVEQQTPGVSTVTWTYAPGQVTIARGPDGGAPVPVERHTLDGLGRLVTVARADGGRWIEISYAYDDANRIARVHDPDGGTTTLTYDLRGALLAREGVDVGRTLHVVDAAGNLAARLLPTGQSVQMTVDLMNRITEIREAGAPQPEVTYRYLEAADPAPPDGVANRIGRPYQVVDRLGTLTFAYDERGRGTREVRELAVGPGGSFETTTTYDGAGRITSLTVPAAGGAPATALAYRYDARGLLASADGLVRLAEHDLAGRATRLVYENGTQNLAEFDPVTGRMTRQRVLAGDGSVLRDQTFAFDDRGNVASMASPAADESVTYTYDGVNRLVAARYGNGDAFGYGYSDGGNVTQVDGVGPLGYGPAPGSNAVRSAGTGTYTYDQAGRMASAPYGTLAFDGFDNLRAVTLPGGAGTIQYDYDFRGQRAVTRRDGAVTALTVTPHIEIQGGEVLVWLAFGDVRVAVVGNGRRLYLHPDLSGTPTLFTDVRGAQYRRLTFGPYGTLRSDSVPAGGLVAGPGGGGLVAEVTGLICLGRRWYDPRLARFISPDPLVPGAFGIDTWNSYTYAHNEPVGFMDPTGCSFWDVMAIIGIGLVVAALIVGAIFTGGATLGVAGLVINVSSGMMVTMAIGIAGGAILGGIAAARAGGSIAAGVLLGGLIGGVGAYAGGVLGAAAGGLFQAGSWGAFIATGLVQGAIAGAATGAAVGFAGGKGSAEQILLAMAKGAAWGALTGAVLGAATKFLFAPSLAPDGTLQATDSKYLNIGLNKLNPAAVASGATTPLTYVDTTAGIGVNVGGQAATGFSGSGFGALAGLNNVGGASGEFEATFSLSGGNVGGVLLGQGGNWVSIPVGWIPQAVMSSGAVTSVVEFSAILDYTGKFSYADQFVLGLELIPIAGLVFKVFDYAKYGWWEDGKSSFAAVFSSNPNPPPES